MTTEDIKEYIEKSRELLGDKEKNLYPTEKEEEEIIDRLETLWLKMSKSECDAADLILSQEAVGHELPIEQCRFVIGTRARLAGRLGIKSEDLEIVALDWNWIDGELGFSLKINELKKEIEGWAKQCGAEKALAPRFRIDADWKAQ